MTLARASNAPDTPIFHPDMPQPWRRRLAQFLRFCESIPIASKEVGATRLILLGSQRYCIEELFWGLSQGIHDFVVVKSRQVGISTLLWALDLWWLLKFPSIQAMYIADSDANKEIHRGYVSAMYMALLGTKYSRGPWEVNNRYELRWNDQVHPRTKKRWRASRLMWEFCNHQNEGGLGISRGINYVHGTELDTWRDKAGVNALIASLATQHPHRLYVWEGTGREYGLLYEIWQQAGDAITSRQIFIGAWRNEQFQLSRDQVALWAAYGDPQATQEEQAWGEEVERRYGMHVSRRHLAWWRWQREEDKGILGNQQRALEKYPWLPEHAFQAVGGEFLSSEAGLRLRTALRDAPEPQYFAYAWGERFDSKGDEVLLDVPKEAATLTIWEEPKPGMIYVLAADPAYGSGPDADRYATTLWRCHPDALVQVAEYKTPLGAMYQFAWVLAHLGGLYRVDADDHLILEIGGPGRAVHEELLRMAAYGFGLTKRGDKLRDVIGAIQHYLYRRSDSMSGQMAWHFNTTEELRIQIFEQLRDTAERGDLVVRSPDLVEEIAALRRHGRRIEASGVAHDDLAFTAALATHCWLESVIPQLDDAIAPLVPPINAPRHQGERMLRSFISDLRTPAPGEETPTRWGVRARAPGR